MRMLSRVIPAIVATLILATMAQAQGRVRPGMGRQSYFPLRSGYEWVYQRTSPAGGTESWRATVLEGSVASSRQNYLALAGYLAGEPRLVRVDGRDIVTEANPSGRTDFLWYQLGAPVGTSWEFQLAPATASDTPDCFDGAKVTVASRSDVVRVPAGEFRDVVHLEYRAQCADAGPVGEWFAPGVGLIKRVESSFAGEVVSELVSAQLGEVAVPGLGYTTTLHLGSPVLLNDLMPPVGPDSLPLVRGAVVLRNDTEFPITLTFTGCKSVAVEVRNDAGEVVAEGRGDDGGCCACDDVVSVTLGRGQLRLPFAFTLASAAGAPLADGRYALTATVQTSGQGVLRPSATAAIEVHSVY